MQRLFFSLKFSTAQQQQLLPYQQQVLKLCPDAKAVDTDNLHLTLFFLSQTDSEQQQRLSSAAEQIKLSAFSLTLDALSCFAKPKILYLAPSQLPDALLQLQQRVAQCCKAEGFSDIHDSYRPHITLARHAVCAEDCYRPVPPLIFNVTEFALYCSKNSGSGVSYQPLTTFRLR
ncbi:RNA 2',3'-cyclic phosphodiesterase [Rheinheimera sp. YQF-2]|uniref:RNA 2',3'-cyclic phosphodiesterase n=1 Tax=Rheinheimera lutimaris TaxID=2740584 RepID=A0A7Y5EGL3_9GAMM|nr:RNA 2',3'-cyclic phosphodiesterase [Rheinheimera lutimaris]NRQ41474.1 RNA 2',3'-cyclic phosphodiesterase [Rheinheimera lutimaris]